MLGASSSEDEDEDYTPGRSDPDDVQSVVLSIPPERSSRKTSASIRSLSPSDSYDRDSYSNKTPTPSFRGGVNEESFSGSAGGLQQNHVTSRHATERSVSTVGPRPPSPSESERSVSVVSERLPAPLPKMSKEEQERLQAEHEEEERKVKLQLYVFVAKCIAYHFNAKQPTDMARRQTKVSKQELAKIKDRFQTFLRGETQIAADEAFINAVQSYFEVFLRSERVQVRTKSCTATVIQ